MAEIDEVLARSGEHAIPPDEIEIESGHDPDPIAVELLRESIPRVGLINPIVVWQRSIGDYLLIAGRNRLEALRGLGASAVPCAVLADRPSDLVRVDENLARRHLTGEQLAELRRVRAALISKGRAAGKSARSIGEELGVSHGAVIQVGSSSHLDQPAARVDGKDGKSYPAAKGSDAIAARRQRVLALARTGKTMRAIAAEVGASFATVAKDVEVLRSQGVDVPNTKTLARIDPEAAQIVVLRSAWEAATPAVRERFMAEIAAPAGAA